jgi:5-methylcytosine-specific restriction endonuclease McrA
MKRTALKRYTPLRKVSKLKHRRQAVTIPKAVREAVKERSGGRCEGVEEICSGNNVHRVRCVKNGSDMHHVKGKGRGGKNTSENIIYLCRSCHRYTHDNPAKARELGLMK